MENSKSFKGNLTFRGDVLIFRTIARQIGFTREEFSCDITSTISIAQLRDSLSNNQNRRLEHFKGSFVLRLLQPITHVTSLYSVNAAVENSFTIIFSIFARPCEIKILWNSSRLSLTYPTIFHFYPTNLIHKRVSFESIKLKIPLFVASLICTESLKLCAMKNVFSCKQ